MTDTTSDILTHRVITSSLGAAHTALICEIVGMLIEKGVLNQGEVISRLERLSKDMMTRRTAAIAVPVVDIVRDYVAGEFDRTLS
jgi:hypothetical protein